MPNIEKATPLDYNEIVKVWESSVKATHDFLADEDFEFYKKSMPTDFLPNVDLYILRDKNAIKGFVGVSGDMLEMLFISAKERSKGYGKTLLTHAIKNLNIVKVDVNEQNEQAVGFYKRFGFKQTARSTKDAMGKNYPILHFSL
ncbi:GNAT family N-acetyltransferase [Dysgonomonas sp. 216]|uniref:GNAT family N-acetyltransferase n=1 Tax=Dysgonomonas sp. 216 TaxID=2302934 RepID=UPI0013D64A75|nr:GNAT family N-acetyltransferase [Dysgonomonas sp. 216]NDW19023.1 GNAT family N-acetyltransferase [Dysgonomonas sp. 216]